MFNCKSAENVVLLHHCLGATTTNSRKRRTTTLTLFSPATSSKRCITNSPPPPPQSTTTISDLPDCIIVEILSRLCKLKAIFGCKCVSKRWFNLISETYFVSRVLSRCGRPTTPYMTTHVLCHYNRCSGDSSSEKKYRYNGYILVPLTSTRPYLPPIYSMKFLPIFRAVKQGFHGPIVEATFSDLVLCCATKYKQRDYYICNSITKQWVALPPTPRVHKLKVPVGFICDPYYADQGNADYRWAVVRIVPNSPPLKLGLSLEIFSSEMGEWREQELIIQLQVRGLASSIYGRVSLAYNGKLYWYFKGFTLELDPFNISGSIRCIPVNESPNLDHQLGVCQGRLRIYPSYTWGAISIWELRENSGKVEWCLIFDSVPMSNMVSQDPKITAQKSGKLDVLGFLPSNEDIIYLKFPEQIVMCNLRENTLEKSPLDPPIDIGFDFRSSVGWFAYVIPWWPTPVPRINNPKVSQVKSFSKNSVCSKATEEKQ